MNRKQLVILLVLVLVLGGLGILIRNHQNNALSGGSASLGQKLLGNKFPINDVARISIKQGTNEVLLAKKDNLWRVRQRGDYPANYSEISDFLIKAQDLKIVQTETVGPSQLSRLALTAGEGTNSALVLDLKDQNEKSLKTLLLGKKHMRKSDRPSPYGDMGGEEGYPDGRWVKVGNADSVAVISDALSNIEPKPDQWLNKDFFKVEKIRSISVTYPNSTNSWKLSRETETGEWVLAEAKPTEKLDTAKTSSLANALTSPTFNDVVPDPKQADLGLDNPTLVSVDTFENLTYNLKVGQKTNDNFPLVVGIVANISKERIPGKEEKPEEKDKLDKEFKEKQKKLEDKVAQEKAYEKWTYLVSNWTLDSLLKERSQLLAEKKEEAKPVDGKPSDAKPEEKPAGVKPEDAPPSAPPPFSEPPK